MAGSSSTPADIANLFESLSVDDEGSSVQQALSSILGRGEVEAVVDWGAEQFAEKLGLKSDNSFVQTGVFLVTKAAILEGAQLIGIGGGLAKGDLGGFQMAQMMKKVEEINRKMDVVLDAPLEEAEKYLRMAITNLEGENIAASIEELKKVKERAVTAFQYTKKLDAKTKNLKNAVKAMQLKVFSEVLIQSYDGTKITPFFHLDKKKKKVISKLIEDDVREVQSFYNSHESSKLGWNKAEKAKKKQDILDSLLQASYPFISEGRGLTSALVALAPTGLSCELKLDADLLPEGEEDCAWVTVGQCEGIPVTVKAWKEGELVKAGTISGRRKILSTSHYQRQILLIVGKNVFTRYNDKERASINKV